MPTPIYFPPQENALQKTLDSDLSSGVTASLTLNNITNIQNKPGVLVVDRIDSGGSLKDAADREFIAYTGTSGSTLTDLTRGVGGSTDQDHSTGAVVEFVPDVVVFQMIADALSVLVDLDDVSTTKYKPYVDSSIQTATDQATVTFDLDSGANRKHKVTLGGNRTLALSNVLVGQVFIIDLIQDGSGSRTVTWFSTIKWANGTEPTLSTGVGAVDSFGFICTSAGNYQGYTIGQNLS